MTNQEFRDAVMSQVSVRDQVLKILKDNAMSLVADGSRVSLHDYGRDIGYTGFYVD